MKKIISILLAITIMCSFTMLSFAANDDTITDGKTYTYTVSKDSTTEATVVPQATGIYKLEVAFADPSAVKSAFINATVYYGNEYVNRTSFTKMEINTFWDYEDGMFVNDLINEYTANESEFYFVAEKGRQFTLELETPTYLYDLVNKLDSTTDVTVKIEKVAATELQLGKTYSTNSGLNIYYIIPKTDTVYNITSKSDSVDIEIYDISGLIGSNHVVEGDEINYVFKLTAGNLYGISVNYCSSIDFTFSDGSKVLPTRIDVSDISLSKGEEMYMEIDVYPYGSDVNSTGIIYTVADEKIATIEYDEELNMYVVYAKKVGTTTATFTEPVSGTTGTITITVEKNSQSLFKTIIDYIIFFLYKVESFFSNLFNWF